MKTQPRYSDACLTDNIHAVVFFDTAVQFSLDEVVAALNEKHGEIGWSLGSSDSVEIDTAAPVLAALHCRAHRTNCEVGFSSVPGRMQGDLSVPVKRSTLFTGAEAAVEFHQSYLCITANSTAPAKADRFVAAAIVTCVSALFAANPNCLGIYFPSADLISSPEQWRRAASVAALGEWPLESWVSFHISRVHNSEAAPPEYSCGSIGLVSFTGHEVSFPLAPVTPPLAAKQVYGACYLLLKNADPFKDGEFIAINAEDDDRHLLLRHLDEGAFGAQSDTWMLIHPDSSLAKDTHFGTERVPDASNTARIKAKHSSKIV